MLRFGDLLVDAGAREVARDGAALRLTAKEFDLLLFLARNARQVFSRDQLHGEIHEVVVGTKPGRERADERILIHTTGLVTQDVAICHYLYQQAKAKGMGITLPAARPPA